MTIRDKFWDWATGTWIRFATILFAIHKASQIHYREKKYHGR